MTVFHGKDVRYKNEDGKLEDYDPSLVSIMQTATMDLDREFRRRKAVK